MTPEKRLEHFKRYREKNREKINANARAKRKTDEYKIWYEQYKEKNRDKRSAYMRKRRASPKQKQKEKEQREKYKVKQYTAQRKKYNENIEESRKKKKAYREKNKEKYLECGRKQYLKHKEKVLIRTAKYRKEHPEVGLKSAKKYLNKLAKSFNLNSDEYVFSLQTWSKSIRKIHGAKCGVCGSNEGLNTHHILFKTYFPELSLNENNGIPLCKVHHNEVHRLNPIYKTRATVA